MEKKVALASGALAILLVIAGILIFSQAEVSADTEDYLSHSTINSLCTIHAVGEVNDDNSVSIIFTIKNRGGSIAWKSVIGDKGIQVNLPGSAGSTVEISMVTVSLGYSSSSISISHNSAVKYTGQWSGTLADYGYGSHMVQSYVIKYDATTGLFYLENDFPSYYFRRASITEPLSEMLSGEPLFEIVSI